MYMRNDWQDTMYQRILKSPLTARNKYVYSDNDFIFLGKIVEAISSGIIEISNDNRIISFNGSEEITL